MNIHEKYMRLALDLARKGEGMTSPNPVVGAVIVRNGRIAGKGYHKKAGLPHAEINAIEDAGKMAKGSTLYVTLEPCDHFGRTPPCTDAIINSGIKNVIVAALDPNPVTSGRGIRTLNKSGINTKVGLLGNEARAMNKPFEKYITKKLPYVTVKAAESLDGKIAARSGDSKWITSESSRRYVHGLRRKADAVMVGANTVLRDDPSLMARTRGTEQPVRIIVDSALRTPLNARIFSGIKESPLIIATASGSSRAKRYEARGARVLKVAPKNGMVSLKALLRELAKMEITNILVEGGGSLNASLFEEGLVDKVIFFVAPKIIGGKSAITPVEGRGAGDIGSAVKLKNVRAKRFGDDIMIEAEVA